MLSDDVLQIASPSSRRAWIEIMRSKKNWMTAPVALLAEGVDRNMGYLLLAVRTFQVALLAEGVDRNLRRLCQCLGC